MGTLLVMLLLIALACWLVWLLVLRFFGDKVDRAVAWVSATINPESNQKNKGRNKK